MGLLSNIGQNAQAVGNRISKAFTPQSRPAITGGYLMDNGYGSPMPISFSDLYTAYKNSGDIFRCIEIISTSVGQNGYFFTDLTGKKEGDKAEIERFEAIVRGPDGTGSIDQIKEGTAQAWGIAGNYYWVLTKDQLGSDIIQWDTMLPQYVTVLTDQYGAPKKYFQRVPGKEVIEFEPEEVIHTKFSKDPEFEVFGISPLDIIIRTEVIGDLAAALSNRKIFENDQIPALMYTFEDYISKLEIEAVKNQLKKDHTGPNNAHKNLYMRGIKDVKPISITNQDAEFTKLRSIATEKVCTTYGVPKSILGVRDTAYGGSSTASVTDSAAMYKLTIKPWEQRFEKFVNKYLFPRLGITKTLFRFNPTSTEDINKIHEDARNDVDSGIITPNEGRKRIGLEAYANPVADELLVRTSQGYVILGETIGASAGPSTATADAAKTLADAHKYLKSATNNEL